MDPEAKRVADSWGLSGIVPITSTAMSRVYRVHGPAVLKVYSPLGKRDEGPGAIALEYFGGAGAAKLLRKNEDAVLLEYLDGPDLTGEPDGAATEILCGVLEKLHSSKKALPRGLVPLERRFECLLTYAGADPLFLDGAAVARELLKAPRNVRVLHGDLHHGNVLQSRERGWLAIDPKGLVGEATFDAANIVYNPIGKPELVRDPARIARQLAEIRERLGFDHARFNSFAFVYGALSACWYEEDGLDSALPRAVAAILRDDLR